MTTIATVRIGEKFAWEYVTKLHAMCRRHLDGDFLLTILTDRLDNVPEEILDLGVRLMLTHEEPHWAQLELFRLGRFDEPALYFDLDTIIVGDLTPMARFPAPLVAIRDINLPMFGSGIMRVEPDAAPEIWEFYQREKKAGALSSYPYKDQEMMTRVAGAKFVTWPDGWCVSVRKDVIPRGRVPDGAKAVYCHGPYPKNADLRHLPWMQEHWR